MQARPPNLLRALGFASAAIALICIPAADSIPAGRWIALGATHAACAVAAWTVATHRRTQSHRVARSIDLILAIQIYFTAWMICGILLGLVGCLRFAPAYLSVAALSLAVLWKARSPSPAIMRPSITLLPLVPLLLIVAWQALAAPEYVYDVLTYHLYFPARWVQDGAISIIPTWCGGPVPDYAPSATEVYYATLMLPFHADWIARAGQFPFWLSMLAACWAFAEQLGCPRWLRSSLVLLLAAIPALAMQAATAMVDVAFVFHLVAALLFSLHTIRRPTPASIIGLVLALALLMGTKFLSLPFLAAFSPILLIALTRAAKPGRPSHRKSAVAIAIFAAMVVGPSWYLRNWLVTGNPVFPLEVRAFDRTLFSGVFGTDQVANSPLNARRLHGLAGLPSVIRSGLESCLLEAPANADQSFNQQGALRAIRRCGGACAILLASLGTVLLLSRSPPRRTPGAIRTLLVLTALAALCIFWLVMPRQESRFAWAPAIILFFVTFASLRRMRQPPVCIWPAVAVICVAAFGGDWYAWLTWRTPGLEARTAALYAEGIRGAGTTAAWRWVDENLHQAHVAYVGNNIPYFLLGRRFENRVRYIPARPELDARFHDFALALQSSGLPRPNTAEPALDRVQMDPRIWLSNLRNAGIEIIVVNSLIDYPMLTVNIEHDPEGFPVERQWLDALCRQSAAERIPLPDPHVRLYRLHVGPDTSIADAPPRASTCIDAIDEQARAAPGAPTRYPLAARLIESARLSRPHGD